MGHYVSFQFCNTFNKAGTLYVVKDLNDKKMEFNNLKKIKRAFVQYFTTLFTIHRIYRNINLLRI